MAKKEKITIEHAVELLSPITSLLTPPQLDEFRQVVSVEHYAKNAEIYSEGAAPSHLLCLLTGKAKIAKQGVGGRQQIMRIVKPGELFGYRAYFASQNYVTLASAFEQSAIATIPMDVIARWMSENNPLSLFFVRQLAIDLGLSDQRTVSLTQKHIRGRLADALLFLADAYGFEEDECTLAIRPTRENIANLSNMTTSNAIRTLSAFAAEELIHIEGRVIRLLNIDEIRQISDNG